MARIAAATSQDLKLDNEKLALLDPRWLKFMATFNADTKEFEDTYQARPITSKDIEDRDKNTNSVWELRDGTMKPETKQNRFVLRPETTFADLERMAEQSFLSMEYNIDADGNQSSDGELFETNLIGRDFFIDILDPEGGDDRTKTLGCLHVINTHPAFWVIRYFTETDGKDELVFTAEYGHLMGFWQTLAHKKCDDLNTLREDFLNNQAAKALGYSPEVKSTVLATPLQNYIDNVVNSIALAEI